MAVNKAFRISVDDGFGRSTEGREANPNLNPNPNSIYFSKDIPPLPPQKKSNMMNLPPCE